MTNTNYPSATPQNPTPTPQNRGNKTLLIGVLAAGLLGTWGYLLWDKNNSGEKLHVAQVQSENYMSQRDSLKGLYDDAELRLDSITGANNNLQGQNSELLKKIEADKAEIRRILRDKNATAADLKRAQELIANLNSQISSLEAEIARLTGENQQLTAQNTQLTSEKQVLEQNLQTTITEKEELSNTVDVGSTFSASNIQIAAVNEKKSGKEKTTTSAKKADKLVVSFDIENRIARSGPADMYIMVTAPNGQVISDPELGSGTLTTRTDGDKAFTSKVGVEYNQGTRKKVEFAIRQNSFTTGDYKIEIYHNGFKIGEGVRTLKKGGLFG
jgi:multidrug efflux pump subunit AcrA (membrane-fusion protein)